MADSSEHRRLQWDERNPTQKWIRLTEADYLTFEYLATYGQLPSVYIYEATKHLSRDYTHRSNRLTLLYHGSLNDGYYLERDFEQFNQFRAHARHIVSRNAPSAERLLRELGRGPRFKMPVSSSYKHNLMHSCVLFSLFMTAPQKGLTFVSREGVLSHPAAAKAAASVHPMAVALPGRDDRGQPRMLFPDDLFALQREDGKRRIFILEIDRYTESVRRRKPGYNTWEKKVANYDLMFEKDLQKKWWGFEKATVLVVTTERTRAIDLQEWVNAHSRFADRYRFAVEPLFGKRWQVPSELLNTIEQIM
jgi:hypothetical protein